MLPAFLGSDGSFPLQFAIIFVVIFVVLAVLVLLIRRFTGRGLPFNKSGPRPRQPRLGIVDVYELDRQRQLILLRRDNVEHLLLVGGPNDVVVERNISRGASVRIPDDEAAREEDAGGPSPDLAPAHPLGSAFPPRAPAFAPSEPIPAFREAGAPDLVAERRADKEPSSAASMTAAPPFTMPLAVPQPQPAFDLPSRADRSEVTAPVPPASRREPQPQPARVLRRTPPPLVNPKPDVASERSRAQEPQVPSVASSPPPPAAEQDFEAAFAAALAAPVTVTTTAVTAAASPTEPTRAGQVDAGVLSDMARQLEEALRRPAPGVAPEPAAIPAVDLARNPAPPEPEPVAAVVHPARAPEPSVAKPGSEDAPRAPAQPREPEQGADPMAAAMASAADAPPDGDDLFEEPPRRAAPEPPHAPKQEPLPAPKPEPSKPQPAPTGSNPFSVEEIEAEFARLLGRPLDRKN